MRAFSSAALVITICACVLLLPVFSQELGAPSSDLTELKARFQTILNEIGSDDGYESSVANLLSKVDNLQRSSDISQNITLNWFSKSGEASTAAWMSTPLRIVLVVSSFEGLHLNSGIGTFYAALSDYLVNKGHSVTILYTDYNSEKLTFQKWQTSFEKRGVKVVRLEASRVKVTVSLLAQRSYQVYRYLNEHQEDFDAVHFPDWEGPGYYTTLAKHEGLAFSDKIFIVGIHGPWRWVKSGNFKGEKGMLSSAEDFETDWLERKSVEYADMIWTPSLDLVQWLSSQGWAFPTYEKQSLYMMPYLPGRELLREAKGKGNSAPTPSSSSSTSVASVTELVFFGRLEKRKGLELFADALDKLTMRRPEFQQDLKITFLGRSTNIGSQSATSYLDMRAAQGMWPFRVTYISHKDRKGALEYLRSESGRVAVMPSLIENAPYTVYECLFLGIPFVASNVPSTAALIHTDDRARALSSSDSLALSLKLESVLDNGASPVRSAFAMDKVKDSWTGLYEIVSQKIKVAKSKTSSTSEDDFQPMVSVCITHYNRPEFLQMAIESVLQSTYKNLEVILVDDGSSTAAAIMYVNSLKSSFDARGWKIVKTGNQYLGAARNTASKLARGEYLLFLDDDNLSKPDQIATYVSVAGKTGSDILTAAHDVFNGKGLPDVSTQNTNVVFRSVPIGASAPLGIFKNCFGDANFFIRKSSFMQIGGFTEERDVGQEDHEFLAKAVLQGYHLLPVPEVLLYYRMHNRSEQMMYTTDPVENDLRGKRPYTEEIDLLKILAFENQRSSRSTRGTMASCNVTVHSVSPDRIPTLTVTSLLFTVSNLDCKIINIHIGTYECTDPFVVSKTSVSCESPSIPIPSNYPITITYGEEPDQAVGTGHSLEIYSLSNPDDFSRAILALQMKTDPDTYSEDLLITTLASISGESPSVFTVASDMVTPGTKRAFTDTRNLRIAVTSTDPENTASEIVTRLIQILTANPDLLSNVGVLLSFSQTAICDNSGSCECTPNFSGPSCDEPASCPNNCSGRGECQDGLYGRVCQCDAGWTGRDCSSGTCGVNCPIHGTCIITTGNNATCQCNDGWSGFDCMIEKGCGSLNCTGRGICAAGKCTCETGFTGDNCELIASVGGEDDDIQNQRSTTKDKGTIAFAVIVAVIGSVLVVIAFVAIYFYYKRHKRETQYM